MRPLCRALRSEILGFVPATPGAWVCSHSLTARQLSLAQRYAVTGTREANRSHHTLPGVRLTPT